MNFVFPRFRESLLGLFSLAAMVVPFAGAPLLGESASPANCTVKPADYLGWKAEEMSNSSVKLEIVPELGGRLMQVTFGGHDYLFVNQKLKGKIVPVDPAQHRWINYGGDKIWPMPEGSQDEQHWVGAGGEPLDAGPFSFQVISQGAKCTVRLSGPVDTQIGQQYIRDISITADSPVISFHSVMKNVSGYPQSWSEQSVSQYNAAAPTDSNQFNPDFWGVTLVNPATSYLNGYHVRTGPSENSAYSVRDGLFRLHWNNTEGEVWVDSPGGWAAVVDGSTGYTMIERIRYQPTAKYPDKATIIFYTTGQRPRSSAMPASGAPPIYYMEAEINSPVVELYPGESYALDTQWYPTRMGSDFKAATYSGVVGQPVAALGTPDGLVLSGSFGVFYAGKLVAHYYSRGGEAVGTAELQSVTPFEPVKLQAIVQAPYGTARVSVHVVDQQGLDRGPLGEAFVNPPPPEARGPR